MPPTLSDWIRTESIPFSLDTPQALAASIDLVMAVIGSAVGASEENGIVQPEPGTLEAMLTASPGPVRFITTHRSQGLPASEIASLPVRQGSTKSPTYVALNLRASLTSTFW